MIWHQLSLPWRGCLEEAWTAYCQGSLPIGSVITDAQGTILARGRNRLFEKSAEGKFLHGNPLAHAEINALIDVKWDEVRGVIKPRTPIFYTTTEPCPLCVGAMRMSGIGEVRYASRDGNAGCADLFETHEYVKRPGIKVVGPEHANLEIILIGMLTEVTIARGDGVFPEWCLYVEAAVPDGTRFGRELFATGQLRTWREEGRGAAFVFDRLAGQIAATSISK